MGLKIRQNGTTYSLPYGDYSYRQTTHSLCYKKDGTVYYCPLCKENETIRIDVAKELDYVHYDKTVYPRIACKIAGEIYYAPNKLGKIASYSIPAGTYTPSAFRSLISNYVSLNGSRNCANAFTVKVNNQTLNISAGTAIHYRQNGSSPGELVVAGFGSYDYDARSIASSFTNYKTYVLYRGNVGGYPIILNNYANYSITITTGINFV